MSVWTKILGALRSLAPKKRYYVLDAARLRPGDIIFTSEEATGSFVIRISTFSRFSHAAIYLGDGLYAEAVGLGVRVRGVGTLVKPRIAVKRLEKNADTDGVRAVDRIDHYLHAPYWTPGAMLSLFRSAKIEEGRSLFCSHLVAKAYSDANVDLVDDYAPHKVTPARLFNSKKLVDVSASVVRETDRPSDYAIYYKLTTLSDQETVRIEKAYVDCLDFFETHGLEAPKSWFGLLVFLVDHCKGALQAQLDYTISNALERNRYFEIADEAEKISVAMFKDKIEAAKVTPLDRATAESEIGKSRDNLMSLRKQLETHTDNVAFLDEELQKVELLSLRRLRDDKQRHFVITTDIIALSEEYISVLEKQA